MVVDSGKGSSLDAKDGMADSENFKWGIGSVSPNTTGSIEKRAKRLRKSIRRLGRVPGFGMAQANDYSHFRCGCIETTDRFDGAEAATTAKEGTAQSLKWYT